ncbi:ATP-binding protein [Paraburkholderia denitrificans]|uniref:histidine kinase n=1 Tax=Paraburkholderia denitrificans TaxID=694025 RepID=A0ABW0JD11_9BURK
MRRGFARVLDQIVGAGFSSWGVAIGLLAAAAYGYTPAGEVLFAPLDRLHWGLVAPRARPVSRSRVATVVIDARTVAALGPVAAYSRATDVRLLERLHGAAAVCLDFAMVTPQPEDALLAPAIARHGRVVLSAQSSAQIGHAEVVLPPSPALAAAAAAIGQRNLLVGAGHTVQGIVPYLKVRATGDEEPHVVLQALRVAGDVEPLRNIRRFIQAQVSSMGQIVPGALALALPTHFNLDQYSYIDVLEGRVPESALAGRIVFVGDTATDLAGGPYRLSAASAPLARVQIDAIATNALLHGRIDLRVPPLAQMAIGVGIALGLIAICVLTPRRRLNLFAFGWAAFVIAALSVLPQVSQRWMPVGPALAICILVYAVYGWRRANNAHSALQRELDVLRAGPAGGVLPPVPDDTRSIDEIGDLMRRIRESRTAYVELIQSLPYPVFVEQGTKLVLSNEQGRELLDLLAGDDKDEAHRAILSLTRKESAAAKASREIRTAELTLNGRTQMMMVTPFGDGTDLADAGSMICFVDVHEIKAAAERDRMTLRHMAHDLRNPLATMLLLLNEHGASGRHTDADFLANLQRLVDYSLRVAQEFTQLSRAEHLDARTYVPLAAADLVAEAVDQVWHGAAAKKIDVEGPHVHGDEAFVLGNRDMLLRSLINLLDNAVKYSPPGTTVDVHVETQDAEVVIRVEDCGIGIAADALPHLFEPFFQAAGASDDPTLGVGLGLPLVQAVVTRHGGRIDVASTLGRGSSFTIRLPRVEADALAE